MKQKRKSGNRVARHKGYTGLDLKKLLIYIFALSLIIGIYLYLSNVNRSPAGTVETTREEPIFRKDGELRFLTMDGSLITVIDIEIANNNNSRMQGLMDRQSMLQNRGMLFIFDFNHRIEMWMRNTYIPLDMIFVRENKTIAYIATHTVPFSEEVIISPEPVRYVIEVNAGFTGQFGIQPGQMIDWY